MIASLGNDANGPASWAPFDTFQETLTFVITLGVNGTPTWKVSTIIVDPTTPFASATRTDTNQLILTLGQLGAPATPLSPAQLGSQGSNLHGAAVTGGATATAIKAQTPQ